MTMFANRTYREVVKRENLVPFQVTVNETDLHIQAETCLERKARDLILKYRDHLESYIQIHPEFAPSLVPVQAKSPAPEIATAMIEASRKAGVGPMAAVAGAIAEYVGNELSRLSSEVIVENGGDLYLNITHPVTVGIFAGNSPLSMRLGLRFEGGGGPFSLCTSSGTVGHSLSLGKADAVCVLSGSAALADAAATSIGNHVRHSGEIQAAVDFGREIDGVRGIVVIKGDKIGLWGDIDLVKTNT